MSAETFEVNDGAGQSWSSVWRKLIAHHGGKDLLLHRQGNKKLSQTKVVPVNQTERVKLGQCDGS